MILYSIYDDDDGHQYLIPKDELGDVLELIVELGYELRNDDNLEMFDEYVGDILGEFERLEDQVYYVVLHEDLVE